MFNKTAKQIAGKLKAAGIPAKVTTDRFGAVAVDVVFDFLPQSEEDAKRAQARDALGLARFRDHIDGVEVVVL